MIVAENCSSQIFAWCDQKLKPFELSFGANSDSSAYTKISQTGFQTASQTTVWVYCEYPYCLSCKELTALQPCKK